MIKLEYETSKFNGSADDSYGEENILTNSFVKGYDKSLVLCKFFYTILNKELSDIMNYQNLSIAFEKMLQTLSDLLKSLIETYNSVLLETPRVLVHYQSFVDYFLRANSLFPTEKEYIMLTKSSLIIWQSQFKNLNKR